MPAHQDPAEHDPAQERVAAEARVAAAREAYGSGSAQCSQALETLARLLQEQEELEAAHASWQELLALRESLHGPQAAELLPCLEFLASDADRAGLYGPAAEMHRRRLEISRLVHGAEHVITAAAGFDLAWTTWQLGRYADAQRLFADALRVRSKEFGEASPEALEALDGIFNSVYYQGQFEETLSVARRGFALAEEAFGRQSLEAATWLNNQGAILDSLGRFDESLDAHREAYAVRKAHPDADENELGTSLHNMARVLEQKGHCLEALELHRQALDMWTAVYGRRHAKTVVALNGLAGCLFKLGKYPEARSLFEETLEICEEVLGPTHPRTAVVLNNLGLILQDTGRYDEARPLYERSIAIKEEIDPNLPELAPTLGLMAKLLRLQGLHSDARPLLERALAIQEAKGLRNSFTAITLQNLAVVMKEQGRLEEARPVFERSIEIFAETHGAEQRLTAMAGQDYAELLEELEETELAEQMYREVLGVRRKVLGAGHPHIGESLRGLGRLLRRGGRFEEALPALEEAVAILLDSLGEAHPQTVEARVELALLQLDLGNADAAWTEAWTAYGSMHSHLRRILWSLSEGERFLYLARQHQVLRLLLTLGETRAGITDRERVYEALLAWKGGATRTLLAGRSRLLRDLGPAQRDALEELRGIQARLSQLVFRPGEEDEVRDARLLELQQRRNQLELELNRSLGRFEEAEPVQLGELRSALPAGSAILDFFVYRAYEPARREAGQVRETGRWGEDRLAVWALRAGGGPPDRFELGPAAEIQHEVQVFLEDLVATRGGRSLGGGAAQDWNAVVVQRLWAPVASLFAGVERIYVSSDSFLGGLPFEALLLEDGNYLIEEHGFVYLQDLSSLAQPAAAPPESVALLSVGAVDFEEGPAPSELRSASGGSALLDSQHEYWGSLPATEYESQVVVDLHARAFGEGQPRRLLQGTEPSETALKSALPGYNVVHLATHGFFEPEGLASMWERVKEDGRWEDRMRAADQGLIFDHPGLLSGLVCAGANAPALEDADDAYLTAEEVGWLDLSGVDLIVLSACQTALGRPQSGEGMLGLRRAFRMAGARTVVSSLWAVRDESTSELMRDFYRNLWQRKMGKHDALREAQRAMLSSNRRKNRGEGRPSTWGAFVLSGSPR